MLYFSQKYDIIVLKINGKTVSEFQWGGKMKEIKRQNYLNELISARENKLIKVITGIRRCGKSYLLDPIYKNYL